MDSVVTYGTAGLLVFLMVCCVRRQKRYWRELQTNRPSTSLRVGYRLAVAASLIGLVTAACFNTPEAWQLFSSVLFMLLFFCLKISFSPSILAATLGLCLLNLHMTGSASVVEVWMGVATALAWRLPEDVRAVYAAVSFVWVLVTFLSAPVEAEAATNPAEAPLDTLEGAMGQFGA